MSHEYCDSGNIDRKETFSKYIPLMNASISSIFRTAIRLSIRDPGMMRTLLHMARASRSAAGKRARLAKAGLTVPPVLIMSITHRCNLRCKGCYAAMHSWDKTREMGVEDMDSILDQAERLGVVFCILAGGEPLMRPEVLEVTRRHQSIIFPLFTNGMLFSEQVVSTLSKQRHVVPIISIAGPKGATDGRRGDGVHHSALSAMDTLKGRGVHFGVSITVDSDNLESICHHGMIDDLYRRGARVFYFIEYVAMDGVSDDLELGMEERGRLLRFIDSVRRKTPGIYIAFPGNEAQYGGCLSSGRGFVHINPAGGLEPCPAAPFTDINVIETSLESALRSPMLAVIRDNHELLDESEGGCALWRNRVLVQKLLDEATDYECTGKL